MASESEELKKDHRSLWVDDMFIVGSQAFGVAPDLKTVLLGRAEDILPVLKRERPIPDNATPSQRKVLAQILDDLEARDARTTEVRGRRVVRSRLIGVTRHRKKDAGRTKARKRFSYR